MAEAVTSVRAAMAGELDDPDQMLLAAFTLIHAGLADEALPLATGACAAAPDEADAWYSLGSVHEYLGNRAEARSALERAITTAGGCFSAASYKLSHLQRWTADDNHVAALAQAACRSPHDAARIAFALFKEYDDLGDSSAAWNSLQHGATIMRRQEPWSAADEAATVAAWRRHLPVTAFDTQSVEPSGGPRRIFVIGLPRSGTTLVERILAAHSQVHAMGEPKAFAVAVRRLTALDDAPLIDARVVAAAADVDPRRIADRYTSEMALFGGGRAVTIDKRTQNIHYVGLIRRAFPDAAIVVLDRAPMDALFGAYKRLFAGSHNWSYAQDDLADHYRNYRDLIDHWAAIPAIGLIRVSLETLIAEPEIVIRDLLDACALPFEDACLRPHQAAGTVMTASASQVRDPINAAGVGAWQRYRAQLMPLYGRLAAEGLL
ncbi:sulfotransferase [Sphingomonas sp. 1P08PE]|uniref:sulfotransferase family protein n=1 Tax=Sphingomonas sp. 1P08PE TaxID=554122 RepID=UPI0039A39250